MVYRNIAKLIRPRGISPISLLDGIERYFGMAFFRRRFGCAKLRRHAYEIK
jgi:hypothetical protein